MPLKDETFVVFYCSIKALSVTGLYLGIILDGSVPKRFNYLIEKKIKRVNKIYVQFFKHS